MVEEFENGELADGLIEIDEQVVEEYGLSVNAIPGSITCNTILIKGETDKLPLAILIDSGSADSFVDVNRIPILIVGGSK